MNPSKSLSELNLERKKLIQEIADLQSKQSEALMAVHDFVNDELPAQAQETLDADHDLNRQSFDKRINSLFILMHKEIQEIEQSLGVDMEDAEEELELKFNNLRNKEMEFDMIESQLSRPVENTAQYQELLERVKRSTQRNILDHSISAEHIINSVLKQRKEFESKYHFVLKSREEQLQKAIQEMQQKFGEKLYQNRKQQKLETIAKQYQQVVQNQKFNIFQQSMEEMNDKYSGYYHHQYTKLHDDYIYKYNELLLKPSNVIPMSQSDNKSPEMSSRKGTKKGTSTSTTWKTEMMQRYDLIQHNTLRIHQQDDKKNSQFYHRLQDLLK